MRKLSMRQAINEALHIAFSSDPNVFSIGEDIAVYGGQLRCSYDLIEHFGEGRIMDTPISENAIIGTAIGSSMLGLRPVVEISYIDFIGVSPFGDPNAGRCGTWKRRAAFTIFGSIAGPCSWDSSGNSIKCIRCKRSAAACDPG